MGMSDPKVVKISGVARPTARVIATAEAIHGRKFACCIFEAVEDAKAVNALAGILDEALVHAQATDGRIDLKMAAIFIIRKMKGAQK